MFKKLVLAATTAVSAISTGVYAAVPALVTTELGTMKDDALVVAGLVLVAIIAVAAFKFMRKGI